MCYHTKHGDQPERGILHSPGLLALMNCYTRFIRGISRLITRKLCWTNRQEDRLTFAKPKPADKAKILAHAPNTLRL